MLASLLLLPQCRLHQLMQCLSLLKHLMPPLLLRTALPLVAGDSLKSPVMQMLMDGVLLLL